MQFTRLCALFLIENVILDVCTTISTITSEEYVPDSLCTNVKQSCRLSLFFNVQLLETLISIVAPTP